MPEVRVLPGAQEMKEILMDGYEVLKAVMDAAVIVTVGYVIIEAIQNWRFK